MFTSDSLILFVSSFVFMCVNVLIPIGLYVKFVRKTSNKKDKFKRIILYVVLPEIAVFFLTLATLIYTAYYLIVNKYL